MSSHAAIRIRILVDADACPVKDEIVRVAKRHGIATILVSNAWIRLPTSALVERNIVAEGPDAADDWIAGEISAVEVGLSAAVRTHRLTSKSYTGIRVLPRPMAGESQELTLDEATELLHEITPITSAL